MVRNLQSHALISNPSRAKRSLGDRQTVMALFVMSICVLFLFVAPVFSQSSTEPMPKNASVKSYGDGWACDIGFRQNDDACIAVVIPENAYDTKRAYGAGWDCKRGFRKSGDAACITVDVPAGGFLDPSGNRWHCMRGFFKVDDTCQAVVLPEHAYLAENSFGFPWKCARGYQAKDDQCAAIDVPENAYLNASKYGQPWTCDRGFFEADGRCDAVVIPANAYFHDASYGPGWKCERGYLTLDDSCESIELPANAHLDSSGNRWECDKNFQRSKGECVLNN